MPDANNICVPIGEDLALICEAVRAAGQIALRAFEANDAVAWQKKDNSPVTATDIAVNDYLAETLQAARPDYGWLSEETKDDHSRHACPRSFVVDPIDGTRAFIARSPNFAVCVAVIENGIAIAGAVYNPLKDEFFAAAKGAGATLNDAPISVNDPSEIAGIRMVGYPRKFRKLGFPDMRCQIANSMAYRMVLVACGQADATVAFTPKSDWDIAAAQIIVSEAGGVVTNIRGVAPDYGLSGTRGFGVICAGPTLHPLLLARVEPFVTQFDADRAANIPIGQTDYKDLGTKMSDRKEPLKSIQKLHLVIGGELVDPNRTEFRDLTKVDFVGAFADFDQARSAWKSAAQRTVDNAHARYFILHAHHLLDPDGDGVIG